MMLILDKQATTVYVELPDNFLYVFVYFIWKDGNAYWQDGFTIWGEEGFELLDGVLLFHKNGTDYTAPIPRLRCEEVATNSWFGSDVSRQISGAVSYPFASKNQRGYLFYRLQLLCLSEMSFEIAKIEIEKYKALINWNSILLIPH